MTAVARPAAIGAALDRVEGPDKVTGAAKYTVDVQLPDQLEGKILRSPHAHARVRKVDWSKALALPGVFGAVDLLNGGTTIRFAGQEILAIAAVDARTAEAALAAVELDLEVLPALIGMDAARADGAPPVYPTRNTRKSAPNASEGPLLPLGWDGNLRGRCGASCAFLQARGLATGLHDGTGRRQLAVGQAAPHCQRNRGAPGDALAGAGSAAHGVGKHSRRRLPKAHALRHGVEVQPF